MKRVPSFWKLGEEDVNANTKEAWHQTVAHRAWQLCRQLSRYLEVNAGRASSWCAESFRGALFLSFVHVLGICFEEFVVVSATAVRSAPSLSASPRGFGMSLPTVRLWSFLDADVLPQCYSLEGHLEPGATVSGCSLSASFCIRVWLWLGSGWDQMLLLQGLQDEWLNLRSEPAQTLSNDWVWLCDLEHKGEKASDAVQTIEMASLRAEQVLGGISYEALQTVPLYSSPSKLSAISDSTLSPGESFKGFPAEHWIRLQPTNGLDFVSHWVFHHPLDRSLRANWCKLYVSKPSGDVTDGLKVSWPGLPRNETASVLYSLEWKLASSFESFSSGLGPATEPWMHSTPSTWSCNLRSANHQKPMEMMQLPTFPNQPNFVESLQTNRIYYITYTVYV